MILVSHIYTSFVEVLRRYLTQAHNTEEGRTSREEFVCEKGEILAVVDNSVAD